MIPNTINDNEKLRHIIRDIVRQQAKQIFVPHRMHREDAESNDLTFKINPMTLSFEIKRIG